MENGKTKLSRKLQTFYSVHGEHSIEHIKHSTQSASPSQGNGKDVNKRNKPLQKEKHPLAKFQWTTAEIRQNVPYAISYPATDLCNYHLFPGHVLLDRI